MLYQKGKSEYNLKGEIFQVCKEKCFYYYYYYSRKIPSCSHFAWFTSPWHSGNLSVSTAAEGACTEEIQEARATLPVVLASSFTGFHCGQCLAIDSLTVGSELSHNSVYRS